MRCGDSIAALKGVGPARLSLFAAAGIDTVLDLLLITPGGYTALPPLCVQPQRTACSLCATIVQARRGRLRGRSGGFAEFRVDCGGAPLLVRLYGQGWLCERFKPGMRVLLSGRMHGEREEFVATACADAASDAQIAQALARLRPRRPKVEGLAAGTVTRLIEQALKEPLQDPLRGVLPAHLPGLHEAFLAVHAPADAATAALGAQRLLLDRFVALMVQARGAADARAAQRISVSPLLRERIAARLPFKLTASQQSAFEEILADLGAGVPMRRLLQGDVGSGKTAVAVAAALAVVATGSQVLFLAPTQELAEQHHNLLQDWLRGSRVKLELLHSSAGVADASAPDILTATHSALRTQVELPRLALVIVDEQHRFGVRHRLAALEKGSAAHGLTLSATPIPRTLALALLGSLPRSVVQGHPPGRAGVSTRCVTTAQALQTAKEVLARGERVFCVFPGIDAQGAPALLREGTKLVARGGALHGIPHACAHGRMPAEERQAALRNFRNGTVSLLLATVLVEVGLDVPAATLMIVMGAERHGLATLHQLRGRVGRGALHGECLLVAGPKAPAPARQRLETLCSETDGFRLAEADLAQRGPGEVLGVRQAGHGAALSVPLASENALLDTARGMAERVLAAPDPETEAYLSALHTAATPLFRPQDAL